MKKSLLHDIEKKDFVFKIQFRIKNQLAFKIARIKFLTLFAASLSFH